MTDHTDKDKSTEKNVDVNVLRREGNTCIGLGAGVGALGLGTATAVGVTCPLCYIVAPALVGMGIYGRFKAKKLAATTETSPTDQNP